jgi:very-short-patch-repair endonuclease
VSERRKIVDNVWAFLDKASALYARMEEERFAQEMHSNMLDCGLQSPLEDLFWVACHVLCKAEYKDINPDPAGATCKEQLPEGVYITPQAKIGNYHVDFLLEQIGIAPEDIYTPVIVELDGHDFHDKDKRQRSYEKARDRFLVKKGYRVLHFTGSDVVADPFKVAYEVLEMLAVFVGNGRRPGYDPKNPTGWPE